MIRQFESRDMERVLDIWLSASIKAHGFIDSTYWHSHVNDMREIYIPGSETFVLDTQTGVAGFYSLVEHQLAALFVHPERQGKGLGTRLIQHAMAQRGPLSLAVYKENTPSCGFYLSHGFVVIKEQIDENTGHSELLMSSKPSPAPSSLED